MTLRSRLTVAFFAISVVPLSAVVLFSYLSSERALRRAAEQQANDLADDLSRRMQWVTTDIERRINRGWQTAVPPSGERMAVNAAQPAGQRAATGRPAASGPPSAPAPPAPTAQVARTGQPPATDRPGSSERRGAGDVSGPSGPSLPPEPPAARIVGVFGDMAPFVEGLEFTPAQPLPPRTTADPNARPRSGAPPPMMSDKMAIDTAAMVAQTMKQYQAGKVPASAEEIAAWTEKLQQQIRLGLAQLPQAPRGGRAGGVRGRPTTVATVTARGQGDAAGPATGTAGGLQGNAFHTEVRQDGQAVGRISARINTELLFATLLRMTPRDREEIPFAVGADGQLHTPRTSDRSAVESLKLTSHLPAEGTAIRSVNNWVVATRTDPSGATLGIARPLGDELHNLRQVALRNFAGGFGLILVVFVASIPLAGGMTRNLRTLMEAVTRLSAGDLAARVEVRSRDEFGRLGTAFNRMAENLAAHEALVVKQERIRHELELGRRIQNEMLPHEPLRLQLAEVQGVSIPAREVGGDFFNYFALPGDEVAVLVGDVSGKGVSAALLMANAQATLRARLPVERDLAQLADTLDRELEASTPPEVYLTLFVGIVDTRRRRLRYVSAGHNAQFVLRHRGGFDRLGSTGRPLGLLTGGGYEEVEVPLEEGDVLFFYTDGIPEAENVAGEFLGTERLEAALASSPTTDVDGILAHVERSVLAFRGSAELADDATMMALRFGENPPTDAIV